MVNSKKLKRLKKQFKIPDKEAWHLSLDEVEPLGTGHYSNVSLMRTSEGKEYAIKKYLRSDVAHEYSFYQEISSYEKSDLHPNILVCHEYYMTQTYFCLVLDYMKCKTLAHLHKDTKGKRYTEDDVRHIVKQAASGLHHLHERNIVHRDIKPQNILVQKFSDRRGPIWIRIADIDVAKDLSIIDQHKTHCKTFVGTFGYFAPEVLCEKVRLYNNSYTYKCDVWSLGVVAYELLSGGVKPTALPLEDEMNIKRKLIKRNKDKIKNKIARLEFKRADTYGIDFRPYPQWAKVSMAAQDLLHKMLTVRPAKNRPSYIEISKSSWIANELLDDFKKPLLEEDVQIVI